MTKCVIFGEKYTPFISSSLPDEVQVDHVNRKWWVGFEPTETYTIGVAVRPSASNLIPSSGTVLLVFYDHIVEQCDYANRIINGGLGEIEPIASVTVEELGQAS